MKKVLAFILILVSAFTLEACIGNTDKPIAATDPPQPTDAGIVSASPSGSTADPTGDPTAEPYAFSMVAPYIYDPETDIDNRYTRAFCSILELDNMFVWHDLTGGPFYFYDKEAGFGDVLCNKPECLHNDSDCNGAASAKRMVCYYEGRLYWMLQWPSHDALYDWYWYIYSMNPDSTDRKVFMQIPVPEDESLQIQRMFIHRGKIYIVDKHQTLEDGKPGSEYIVSVCDFDKHDPNDFKPVIELKNTGGFTDVFFFEGDDVYLLANANYGGEDRLKIFRYDSAKDETSVVVDILPKSKDFYTDNFWIQPNGDIYIGEVNMILNIKPKVYKIVDNKLEACLDFDDGKNDWGGTYVNEDVVMAYRLASAEPWQYEVWVKDYDGNTIYNGLLSIGYKIDNGVTFNGEESTVYWGASKDRILAVFTRTETDDEGTVICERAFFVEYDITENGLEEKTLVERITYANP